MESDVNSKKYVNAIIKASESAASLVQQLLAFTKEEEQLFEIINLNKILTDWQELLKQIAGDTIRISLDLPPSIFSISGNPEKIRQVIMNLVINACEAMPRGGDIVIKTKNVDFKKNQIIKNEVINRGSYVSLSLTDSGIGIEEELIDEIFKPPRRIHQVHRRSSLRSIRLSIPLRKPRISEILRSGINSIRFP